jgi:hypothetical protein
MNINTNTYDIKYTPDFAYTPINSQSLIHTQNVIEEKQKNTIDTYISKFKTSFYGFLLFIILSLPVAYKILDMIGKIISQNIEIYDFDTEEPSPLGRVIMGLIVLILLFIL